MISIAPPHVRKFRATQIIRSAQMLRMEVHLWKRQDLGDRGVCVCKCL